MVVAMASGDGFAPHKGAMDTAARAAETMWWWDPSPVGTDRATNGAAPTKKSKKDSGGADGTWRTRDELVQAGSGTKAPTPAKDRARWTPWDQLIDTSEDLVLQSRPRPRLRRRINYSFLQMNNFCNSFATILRGRLCGTRRAQIAP